MPDFARLAGKLSLDGRTAVVTGASGGIGRAVVADFVDAGAQVISVDRPGAMPPPHAEHVECDLGDRAALTKLATELAARTPVPDVFVHAAGITRDGVMWKIGDDDWDSVMRINLDAAWFLLRALVPGMRAAERGHAVLIASVNGENGRFGQTNYAASKAGLIGFAKSAAQELARFGIRVNVVSPGYVDSPMTRDLPDEVKAAAVAATPLGKLGSPEDIASAVLYLCTGLSAHVTGHVLRVDGGYAAP